MVLPGNFLKLGLGLNPRRDLRPGQDGALVRVDNAAEGFPSYATNIERFHHTVKRARSIIESRDATVAVSQSEIHSILTKIEELDRQVRALLPNGPEPTSPVPRLGPGSQPTSDKTYGAGGARDQDCDAENLIYDLGARAVVDADGHVSGHPLFRRNANCPMESAVNGKNPANAGGSSDSPKGPAKSGTAANGGDGKANPNTSPPTTGDASSENHKSGHPKGANTSPEEKQNAKAEGSKGSAVLDVPGSDARTGLPQVVSATVETVEVKTVPVNGELVMTTVTRTTTRLSTVTVVRHHKATGSAAKQTPDDAAAAVKNPQDGTGKGVEKPKVSQNVPVAPSAGSFAQFSNDTAKVSNSTAASHASQAEDQKTANIAVDDKSFNHTAVDKAQGPGQIGSTAVQQSEEAGNSTTPQDAASLTPEKSANHTAAPDKVVGTPGQQAANLTGTGDSGAKAANTTADKVANTPNQQQQAANLTEAKGPGKEISNNTVDEVASTPNQQQTANLTEPEGPGKETSNTAAHTVSNTPNQQAANLTGTEDAGEKAADTVADDTSLSSASEPDANPAPDAGDLNGRVKVITVVPIPAQLGGASPAAATAAGSPDMAREKAEPAVSAAVGANEAVRRAQTGFKTVRVSGSK